MDPSNVNIMDDEISSMYNTNLLDVGTCGLHVINGAFKDGSVKSQWPIQNLLLSLYRLFKDTPARRDNFISVTASEKLPLKFCAHRWLGNVSVAERVVEIWPHIK